MKKEIGEAVMGQSRLGDDMSEWRPIETAPRDGTDVLVGCLDADHRQFTAPILLYFEPTHWLPLPELPERLEVP